MRSLPKEGLIVSCYLESMKGAERNFISAVAHVPGVAALRVEGIDNIEFARRIAPDAFLIGLVKRFDGDRNYITPDFEYTAREIIHAGANMVAAEGLDKYIPFSGDFSCPVMWDLHPHDFCLAPEGGVQLSSINCAKIEGMTESRQLILATTFMQKAFDYIIALRSRFPATPLNLEGGIGTHAEIAHGFQCGANYVTMGKAINDPATIIAGLLNT